MTRSLGKRKRRAPQVIKVAASEISFESGEAATISPYGAREDMRCTVTGSSGREFFILRLPRVSGLKEKFRTGDEIMVRTSWQGSVFGFSSMVLNMIMKPAPLLFVEYPYTLEKMDLRRHARIDCSFPGRAYCRAGSFSALFVDLSLGGCRITVGKNGYSRAKHAVKNDLILLELLFAGSEELFLGGTIRNVESTAGAVSWGIGFLDPGRCRNRRISEFIEHVEQFRRM